VARNVKWAGSEMAKCGEDRQVEEVGRELEGLGLSSGQEQAGYGKSSRHGETRPGRGRFGMSHGPARKGENGRVVLIGCGWV
jgi:hypothetical protein